MDIGYHEITLETVMDGAAGALFAEELRRVVENLVDPNTDPKVTRELALVFKFRPTEDRRAAGISVVPKTKLAPNIGEVDVVHLVREGATMKAVAMNAKQEPLFADTAPEQAGQHVKEVPLKRSIQVAL